MDTNTTNSLPEHDEMPSSINTTAAAAPSPNSLIHTPVIHQKAHAPALLWVLVLITLLGTGFLGYMAYAHQTALDSHGTSMKAYQDNLKQWTDQVNVLQTSVQDLRTQVSQLPTALPTASPFSGLEDMPGMGLGILNGIMPTSVALPDDQDLKGDDAMMFDDSEVTDPNSLSNGQMTAEDETGMVNSYLSEIKNGEHKTSQPDGIAVFKSRQVSTDGGITYDIFRSTTEEDTFYIYVRQGTGIQPGWFGPFTSFPGS